MLAPLFFMTLVIILNMTKFFIITSSLRFRSPGIPQRCRPRATARLWAQRTGPNRLNHPLRPSDDGMQWIDSAHCKLLGKRPLPADTVEKAQSEPSRRSYTSAWDGSDTFTGTEIRPDTPNLTEGRSTAPKTHKNSRSVIRITFARRVDSYLHGKRAEFACRRNARQVGRADRLKGWVRSAGERSSSVDTTLGGRFDDEAPYRRLHRARRRTCGRRRVGARMWVEGQRS